MPTRVTSKLFVVGESSSTSSLLKDVTTDDLRSLQLASGYPLISIFVPTAPDLLIGPEEHARALALITTTEERLVPEVGDANARRLTDSLRSLVSALVGQRTGRGLALFVGPDRCVVYRMPESVEERIVVDPTFATRDIARAVNLHPPYRIVLLGTGKARMFIGTGNSLREVNDNAFPVAFSPSPDSLDRKGHRLSSDRASKERQGQQSFVRRVAQLTADHADGTGLPLIVIASTAMASLARKELLLDPIDVVVGSYERAAVSRLAQLARPSLDGHLSAIREKSLARLDAASRQRRSALGIHHVWTVARRNEVELLVVDESFRYPAWTTLGGQTLVRAFSAEMPDVLDDAVDEIIEMVQRTHGTVCFVRAGELGSDGIAAVRIRL